MEPLAPPNQAENPYTIPMYDEQLNPVMVAPADVQNNLKAGYTIPTPEEVSKYHADQEYGSLGQQAITGLEGAASAATFGGSTALEVASGLATPEAIRGRREANPIVHGAGQFTGLVLPSLLLGPEFGAAGLMEEAGVAGAKALVPSSAATFEAAAALRAAKAAKTGVDEANAVYQAAKAAQSAASRIGSTATKLAVENMVFQSGDELSKAFSGDMDPNHPIQTAIADIGLAGLLGGALGGLGGGTKELWNMGPGKKLGALLDGMKGRTEPTPEMLSVNEQNTAIGGTNALLGAQEQSTNAILSGLEQNRLAFEQAKAAEAARSAEPGFIERLQAQNKLEKTPLVEEIKARASVEGAPAELVQTAGVPIPESMAAALGDNPETRHMYQVAMQGSAKADKLVQGETAAFQDSLKTGARDALGKTETDLKNIDNISDAKQGDAARKELVSGVKQMSDAVAPAFEELKGQFKNIPLLKEDQASISSSLGELMTKEGLHKAPSSAEYGVIKKILKEIPLQETAEDLYKYIQIVGRETDKEELYHIGKQIKSVLRDELNRVIETQEPKYGAQWVEKAAATNKAYSSMMDVFDKLNDRLKLGNYAGPKDFLARLASKSGLTAERLMARLNIANDADLMTFLRQSFPGAAKAVEDHQLNGLVQASRTADRSAIDVKKLFKNMSDLSPELKDAVISKESQARISAIHELERRIPENMNKSGSAKTIMDLVANLPASGIGMAAGIFGGPVGAGMGFALKKLGDYVGKEAPASIRLATLKMLASPAPTNPSAFQTAVKAAAAFIRGETKVNKVIGTVLKGTSAPIASKMNDARREKLVKQLDEYAVNPMKMVNVAGDVGHYLPEHATAIGETAMRSVNYLNSIKPNLDKKNPLDTKIEASPMQKAAYNRALDIAEQPLIVIEDIKDGTITPQDIIHLKSMYPSFYNSISKKLMNSVVEHIADENVIPYKTRMGLSLFVGQPLDSTMTPESLMALNPPPQAPMQQGQPKQSKHSSMKDLGKIAKSSMTVGQGREAKKAMES